MKKSCRLVVWFYVEKSWKKKSSVVWKKQSCNNSDFFCESFHNQKKKLLKNVKESKHEWAK